LGGLSKSSKKIFWSWNKLIDAGKQVGSFFTVIAVPPPADDLASKAESLGWSSKFDGLPFDGFRARRIPVKDGVALCHEQQRALVASLESSHRTTRGWSAEEGTGLRGHRLPPLRWPFATLAARSTLAISTCPKGGEGATERCSTRVLVN
jgi:hypothetical protein